RSDGGALDHWLPFQCNTTPPVPQETAHTSFGAEPQTLGKNTMPPPSLSPVPVGVQPRPSKWNISPCSPAAHKSSEAAPHRSCAHPPIFPASFQAEPFQEKD